MRQASARCAVLAAVVLSLALTATAARAHRVNVFAYVEGDTVHVECSYRKSDRVRFGAITVKNPVTGQVYLTGKTDEQGNFAFPVPEAARAAKADLQIVLVAGEGHQNDWVVAAKDYLSAAPAAVPAPTSQAPAVAPASLTPAPAAAPFNAQASGPAMPAAVTTGPGLTSAQIQAVVEVAVENKIAPIRRMLLDEKEKGPGLTEIGGGIGYLVGIAGLLAYARSRRGRTVS
jgi:nickel transport protein